MKTLIIPIFAALILIGCDCNFNPGLGTKGNGHVVTEERAISEDFNMIDGNSGLEIILTQGSENKIIVEADENLLEIIETEIEDGKLAIFTNENIGFAKAKKVHITYKNIDGIEASSGSEIKGNSVLKSEHLNLEGTSGATMMLELFSRDVLVSTGSGANLTLSGNALLLTADASSGSKLDARDLKVVRCEAEASSGASISVHVKESLTTNVSSGGDIKYYGNPTDVSRNDSHSGNVQKM